MDNSSYNYGMSAAGTVNTVMRKVYFKMTLGLLVSAFTAVLCASSGFLNFYLSHSWLMWVLIIAEFGLLFGISGMVNKQTATAAAGASLMFYLFSLVNGATLCTIFLIYSTTAIVKTFFITAGTFGAMSVYGYFTDRDLSRMGSILTMALFGLIIACLVNIFTHSNTLNWIISIAGVLIFVGLTAWDTQQIKRMSQFASRENASQLATVGALSLYLDFLNLFLFLLRIFGGNRD